jgi:hypothetical protein
MQYINITYIIQNNFSFQFCDVAKTMIIYKKISQIWL